MVLWFLLTACVPPAVADPALSEKVVAEEAPDTSESARPVRDDSGCVARIEQLPDWDHLYGPDDPRLHGEHTLVVLKAQRAILHFSGGVADGCWDVALGYDYPSGTKTVQGDRKTPEGWYRTSDRPSSSYYGAMLIHYPALHDAERGLAASLISQSQRDAIAADLAAGRRPEQYTRLGGLILIHGGGSDYDWTLGCVALDDEDIDALRSKLPEGKRTDILVLP